MKCIQKQALIQLGNKAKSFIAHIAQIHQIEELVFKVKVQFGRTDDPTDIAPILEFLVSDNSLVLRNEKIIIDGETTL